MVRQRRAFVALLVVIVLIAALLFVRNVVAGNSGHRPSTSGLQAVKVGSLPAPRADLVAAAVGDQVVVAAGYDGTATSPDVWSTGDGTTFTTIARLPEPVRYPAGLVRDNKLFLIGGDT